MGAGTAGWRLRKSGSPIADDKDKVPYPAQSKRDEVGQINRQQGRHLSGRRRLPGNSRTSSSEKCIRPDDSLNWLIGLNLRERPHAPDSISQTPDPTLAPV